MSSARELGKVVLLAAVMLAGTLVGAYGLGVILGTVAAGFHSMCC